MVYVLIITSVPHESFLHILCMHVSVSIESKLHISYDTAQTHCISYSVHCEVGLLIAIIIMLRTCCFS